MKKLTSVFLAVLMLASVISAVSFNAEDEKAAVSFETEAALYVHAAENSNDTEAWHEWQSVHDEDYVEANSLEKYFFLPSSAGSEKVDIYNAFQSSVTVNGTEIEAGKTAAVNYEQGVSYDVEVNNVKYTLKFMKSSAEAAIYVNNSDADGKGTDLMSYLNDDKDLSAKATGAIVTPDGSIDNTAVKKIKGRGNTTWAKAKKPYNITYDKKVSIAGMKAGKKYSLLANYQDDSLARNRFLYDLSDAVGMPYASDSRFVDFYANGYYWGSYQLCEKVEVGSSSLVSDFEEEDYLNEDKTVKEDFPFLCEVDSGATEGEDYFVKLSGGLKITIKAPELTEEDEGYTEVQNYVKEKFESFYNASRSKTADLSDYADVDSLAKIYLINELGKNWDAGVSSLFFTYKADENGKFKFYASPVWDYDNSLGNAVGVARELDSIKVYDYEDYTGWWCKYKGLSGSSKSSSNIMNRFAQNAPILERAKVIWKEKFIPAINHFTGAAFDENINKYFYTAENYYNLLKDSAEMNYTSGWLLDTGDWIALHTSLKKASFDADTNTYSVNKYPDTYAENFEGVYNYCRDWLTGRAAWLSKEMADGSVNEVVIDNAPSEPETLEPTSPEVEPTQEVTPPAQTEPTQPADKPVVKSKKANPIKASAKKKTLKAKKLKKKKQTFKAITVQKAQGGLSYTKLKKGTSAKIYKKIKVNKKNGKITLKKGKYSKKTYKLAVKITAKGNQNYNSGSKTVTVKINVK